MASGGFRSMDDMLRMDFDDFRTEISGAASSTRSLPGSQRQHRSAGPQTVQQTVTANPAGSHGSHDVMGSRPGHPNFHGPVPGAGFPAGLIGALMASGMRLEPQLSYEQMLQMDRNNVKRGVKTSVVRRLRKGRAPPAEAAQKCQICLNQLGAARSVAWLPCKHPFCEDCIGEWLKLNSTCPVCRWEFPESDTHIVNNT